MINKDNIGLRSQQFIILALHLILLYWIHFALTESGHMRSEHVFYHFLGIGLFGAVLIRGCAEWGKWLYRKERREQEQEQQTKS